MADLADAIVNQLAWAEGAKLTITVEVEAESEADLDNGIQRTVTENAATLKFESTEFDS